MRRLLPWIAALALLAVVAIGLSQAGKGGSDDVKPLPLAAAEKALQGSPPELAGLHAQGAQLLDGGKTAFERRVRALRGRPIVVNKWAEWCGPCRTEFPLFQHAVAKYGKSVAFLGVDSKDADPAARKFLRAFPVAYPSYADPSLDIAAHLTAPGAWPTTIFLDKRGEVAYLHQGQYRRLADLERDITRYAGA